MGYWRTYRPIGHDEASFWVRRLVGSTPPLATGTQPTASTSHQPDDLLPEQPAPKTTVPATILQTDQANGVPHNE